MQASSKVQGKTAMMVANVIEHAQTGQSVLVLAADDAETKRISKLFDDANLSIEHRAAIVVKSYRALERGAVAVPSPRFNALYEDHRVSRVRAEEWQAAKQSIADVVMWPE